MCRAKCAYCVQNWGCSGVPPCNTGKHWKKHLGFVQPLLFELFFYHCVFRNPLLLSHFPHPCIHIHHPTEISSYSLRSWGLYLLDSGDSSPSFLHWLMTGPNHQSPSRPSPQLDCAAGGSWSLESIFACLYAHFSLPLTSFPLGVFSCPLPTCPGKHTQFVSSPLFSAVSGYCSCLDSWL